ncbi:hypothetical protein VTI74DRAFT_4598 [Chaetomium olivicolor]
MRETILTSLLLASATLTSASRFECLHARSRELAVAASCGDEGSLNYCFSNLPLSTPPETLATELERCFHSAGCTPAESQIEAFWVLRRCDSPPSDLRHRRSNEALAAAPAGPLLAARNPLPAAITAMNLPRQTPASTATNGDTPASPSPCFTDTTSEITHCPIQTTGSESGKQLSCYPTVMTSAKCREGLICQFNNQGNPSCMYKHSGLEVDGIVIAVVFASAIVISVVGICFMCCRERREHRRIERAAEAARIAKEAKTQATVQAKRPGVNVTGGVSDPVVEGQPLMYSGGAGAEASQQGYFPPQQQGQQMQQGYGAANPFADAGHDGHPLR